MTPREDVVGDNGNTTLEGPATDVGAKAEVKELVDVEAAMLETSSKTLDNSAAKVLEDAVDETTEAAAIGATEDELAWIIDEAPADCSDGVGDTDTLIKMVEEEEATGSKGETIAIGGVDEGLEDGDAPVVDVEVAVVGIVTELLVKIAAEDIA